jgi:hypothetical protein
LFDLWNRKNIASQSNNRGVLPNKAELSFRYCFDERGCMKVSYQMFRSSSKSWDELFLEAAEFASTIEEMRLINITQCCDNNNSVVTVWYWGK